jgi:hypothetical protein
MFLLGMLTGGVLVAVLAVLGLRYGLPIAILNGWIR